MRISGGKLVFNANWYIQMLEESLKSLPSNMKHLISFMDEVASAEKDMGVEEHPFGSSLVSVVDN